MYKGKEICQGCRKPGTEQQRFEKDNLCHTCRESLNLGTAINAELKTEYAFIFQHYYAFRTKEVNHSLQKLLEALSNPTVKRDKEIDHIKYSSGSNGNYFTVPLKTVEPMKDLWLNFKMGY